MTYRVLEFSSTSRLSMVKLRLFPVEFPLNQSFDPSKPMLVDEVGGYTRLYPLVNCHNYGKSQFFNRKTHYKWGYPK
jgi:hypothetical protein